MASSIPASLVFPLLLHFFFAGGVSSQSTADAATTDFSCSSDSPSSCQTYLSYRARSDYMNLGNISDLFGVSRLSIAQANNLTSEDAQLMPNQLLLIPITCTCNGSLFFSNVTYHIKKDDSLYFVSITTFENLTNSNLVQEMNPSLHPNSLKVGEEVVFPLLCRCPRKELEEKGIKYLITYVWQPGDDILAVSSMFKVSPFNVLVDNNYRNFSAAVCLPILIPVTKLPVIIQTQPSPREPLINKHLYLIIVILGTTGAFSILSTLLLYIHRLCKKRNMLKQNGYRSDSADLNQVKKASKAETVDPRITQSKLLLKVSGCLDKPTIFDEKLIKEATMNLSDQYRIGRSVYKAVIKGEVFAVKKFKDSTEEIKILQRLNHANLVKLMGISFRNDEDCFLVYEYAENGSLDKWLFSKSPSSSSSVAVLSWTQRLNVALDIANGLQYMHEHSRPSIAHMDVQTSSILLSSNFRAKVSNFYSARPATCPEELKTDVFAFGVILFELLSGRKAVEQSENGEIVEVWDKMRGGLEAKERRTERLGMWMDKNLQGLYPIDDALSLAYLAKACTSEISSARPTMTEIVFNLSFIWQSSLEMCEGSWISGLEPEEASHIFSPIIAR